MRASIPTSARSTAHRESRRGLLGAVAEQAEPAELARKSARGAHERPSDELALFAANRKALQMRTIFQLE
jgi:hypothetical protein